MDDIEIGFTSNLASGQLTGILVEDILIMVRDILDAESTDLLGEAAIPIPGNPGIRLEELKLYNSEDFAEIVHQHDTMAYRPSTDSYSDSPNNSSHELNPLLPLTDIGV